MSQDLADKVNRKFDDDRDALINTKIKQERDKSPVKINAEKVRERLMLENLTEKEKKLAEMKIMITGTTYDQLWRFFDFMKYNVNEKNQSKCFMTQDSLRLNLKKYFGHKTNFLDARLYSVLSDGQVNRRIYFDQFIEQFYIPLFEKPPIVKANFMFKMLDIDGDGYLHASDLVEVQDIIDELSDFGEEVTKLSQYYLNTYLESRGKIRDAEKINIYKYKDLLDDSGTPQPAGKKPDAKKNQGPASATPAAPAASDAPATAGGENENPEDEEFVKFRSCGIDEIKNKIMAEPEKFKDTSCFIASKAQIERAKQREKAMLNLRKQQTLEQAVKDGTLQGNPNKQLKAIIAKENKIKDPFRIKKAVTFMINLTQSESDDDDDDEEKTNQD